MSRLSPTSLMMLRMPSTLILSLPKYSSAGATRTGGAFACAATGLAVGFAAGTGRDSAAVVVTATNETQASNRFNSDPLCYREERRVYGFDFVESVAFGLRPSRR